jgi:hypothetical protein
MNKSVFNFTGVIAICFLLSACCTKKLCLGFDRINEVRLMNFSEGETDSVAVEIFEAGSGSANHLDSSFLFSSQRMNDDSSRSFFLPETIRKDHRYKITFISSALTYTIGDFETSKEECNCPSDKFDVLSAYSINGAKKTNSVLVIYK